jgi:hypothetical protein
VAEPPAEHPCSLAGTSELQIVAGVAVMEVRRRRAAAPVRPPAAVVWAVCRRGGRHVGGGAMRPGRIRRSQQRTYTQNRLCTVICLSNKPFQQMT